MLETQETTASRKHSYDCLSLCHLCPVLVRAKNSVVLEFAFLELSITGVMSDQAKLRGNAIKRSASYNGFSFGLPSKIDELKVEDTLSDSGTFSAEWSAVFQKQGGCRSLITSPNQAVDCSVSNGFGSGYVGTEKVDVSLTELSDAFSGSDAWQEDLILRLRRQEAVIEKDKARLEEEVKTLQLKLELEEDLRRNDKECMDILRSHISKLEGKLQSSEKKIRELEHEKQRLEVNPVSPATKPGEFALVKARLDASVATIQALETDLKRIKGEKSKLEGQGKESQDMLIKLEHQLRSANKELQRRENRVNQLVEERRSLEDYQIKARSLQRKDQKSSYALQIQIVNLQEKLEISSRANEELASEKEKLQAKVKQLEDKIKELEGSYRSKLEKAMERLKRQKSHTEENHNNKINGHSRDDMSSSVASSDSLMSEKDQSRSVDSIDTSSSGGDRMSTLVAYCSALLMELNKQIPESSCQEFDSASLVSSLNEFLGKTSSGFPQAPQEAKFIEKPLKLGGVVKEASQEEIVWEKNTQTVSKIILGLKLNI